MIDYDLTLCYGIIVSDEKMKEIKKALTDEEYDGMIDNNYARCLNSWTGEDYFIGVMVELTESETNFVYRISELTIPSDNDEDLINLMRFFNKHDLWKFIDWKPERMIINFCY